MAREGTPLLLRPPSTRGAILHGSECVHRTRRTVEPRVRTGDRRRQHNERKERAEMRKAVLGECRGKRAFLQRGVIPRQNRDEQGDRDDVEGNDPPRHVAHAVGMLSAGSAVSPAARR